MLMGIRRDLIEEGMEINVEDEGVVGRGDKKGTRKMENNRSVSKGVEVMSNSLEKWIDKKEKELIVLGGGF